MAIGGNSSALQVVFTQVALPPSCAMVLFALSIKLSTQQHGLRWVPAMVAKLFNSLNFPEILHETLSAFARNLKLYLPLGVWF